VLGSRAGLVLGSRAGLVLGSRAGLVLGSRSGSRTRVQGGSRARVQGGSRTRVQGWRARVSYSGPGLASPGLVLGSRAGLVLGSRAGESGSRTRVQGWSVRVLYSGPGLVSERRLVGRAGICISLWRPGRYSGPSDWFSLGPVGDWTSDLSYPTRGPSCPSYPISGPFRPLLDPTDHQPRPFPVFRHLKWRTPTTLVNQTSIVDDTRPHDTLSPNRKSETDRSQKNAPAHRPMRIFCCAVPNFLIVFKDMVCSYLQILSLSAPVSAGSRLGSCRTK